MSVSLSCEVFESLALPSVDVPSDGATRTVFVLDAPDDTDDLDILVGGGRFRGLSAAVGTKATAVPDLPIFLTMEDCSGCCFSTLLGLVVDAETTAAAA